MIVARKAGVTLVGGGGFLRATLEHCLRVAPHLVAADGGAGGALRHGAVPEATIGDLDSLAECDAAQLPAGSMHHIAEQDSTDFEKCLRNIAAPFVLATGFLGGRADHTMAALSALVQHKGARCILVGEVDIVVHLDAALDLDLPPGTRVSLFPMGEVTGHSRGLTYSIDGIRFAPWGRIGTSNAALGGRQHIAMDGPGMLLMLPAACLSHLLGGLGIPGGPPAAPGL